MCVEAGWDLDEDLVAALDTAGSPPILTVTRRSIERIASTSSPQPVVAEVDLPLFGWRDLATGASLVVAVDVNDPGNLGTIIRSAASAGFHGVACLGDTVDPFAPKTIRATAGAGFGLPIVIDRDPSAALDAIASLGATRLGTRMTDAVACDEADLSGPVAFVLGSEAHGLGRELDDRIDGWLRIPMAHQVESLNVAMAGAILTYEAARQRRSLP